MLDGCLHTHVALNALFSSLQNITYSLTSRLLNRCKTHTSVCAHTIQYANQLNRYKVEWFSTLLLKKVMRNTVILPFSIHPHFLSMDDSWLVQNILNLHLWSGAQVDAVNHPELHFHLIRYKPPLITVWNIYSQYTSHFWMVGNGLKNKLFLLVYKPIQANVFANFSSKSRPKSHQPIRWQQNLRACSQILNQHCLLYMTSSSNYNLKSLIKTKFLKSIALLLWEGPVPCLITTLVLCLDLARFS